MANYIDSLLLAFQARINKRFNEAELREQQTPILRVGLGNQDFVMQNAQAIRESTRRDIKGYQFKRMAATNGTTRTHNHTGNQGDSMEVTLNWATFSETFSVLLTIGDDNIIKRPDIVDNQIMQVQRILRERIGLYLVQQLHAGRTQVANAVVRNAVFNAATDAFEISQANRDDFFAFVASVMQQHKYFGKLDLMVDNVLGPVANKLRNQGNSNANNLAYQFGDFSNILQHNTLGIDVATDYADGAVAIALPENSFAFIPWIPAINRRGFGDYESYVGGYGTLPDGTGLPLNYAVHGYADRVDGGGASGGSTQDVRVEMEMSVDVAFQSADISTANETPIYEFAMVA
jgi:hypothetical protein